MKISKKIMLDMNGLTEYGPINIVAFGDSVTHGAFALGDIDCEAVYWNILKKKIAAVRNYMPINVINAGIGGTTAKLSVARIDSQVLCHKPDLVIVCFGLNDVNGEKSDFLEALEQIFARCLAYGTDVIFMTPNMLNTYVAEDTAKIYRRYAKKTAEMQNGGKMDDYIYSAVELAEGMGIPVCDCYSKWKEMAKTADVTMMLSNRINHPTKELHKLFADSLFEIIFPDGWAEENVQSSTMYNDKK